MHNRTGSALKLYIFFSSVEPDLSDYSGEKVKKIVTEPRPAFKFLVPITCLYACHFAHYIKTSIFLQ